MIRGILLTIYFSSLSYFSEFVRAILVFYPEPERWSIIKHIKKIRNEKRMLLEINEGYQIYMTTKNTRKIPGEIAEVGVYKGGSAKIISLAKGDKSLYLFDTFSGLPKLSSFDNPSQFQKGLFSSSLSEVKKYLSPFSNIYFYKGLFPKTGKSIKGKKFSFVHLDLDIYKSTYEALHFFYPRINRGGVIISHDYANASGVKHAFYEFFSSKPEIVIELAGSQCLVVKL